jgi:hypothetical protein
MSLHNWAAAIDMNAGDERNKMHLNPTPEMRFGGWSKEFIDCMTTSGIYYGGYFITRCDPMHYCLYSG